MCRQDKLVLHIGGVEFQLYHDKGETDDHTWVYVPRHNGPADRVRHAAAHPATRPLTCARGRTVFFFFAGRAWCSHLPRRPVHKRHAQLREPAKGRRFKRPKAWAGTLPLTYLSPRTQVQRYPREWSAALKKMLALNASILLPGHGTQPRASDRFPRR